MLKRCCLLVVALGWTACAASEPERVPVGVEVVVPAKPSPSLISLGSFSGRYIAASKRMIVVPSVDAASIDAIARVPSMLAKSADPDSHLPASSSGVPTPNPPGGLVAFSPYSGGYSGTCPGSEPNRYCGIVRLANRYASGGPTTLRNVYASITSITAGYSQVNSTRNAFGDSDRSSEFGAAVTAAQGGLWYYGHLSPSDYPSSGTQPGGNEDVDTGGFRVDRLWSFTGPGGDFAFTFEVYGNPVACGFASGLTEDPYASPYDDRDCDGLPGASRAAGVFASNGSFANGAPRGSDATGLGTFRRPLATIKKTLDAQFTDPTKSVYLAGSTFAETSTLSIRTAPRVLGGFDPDNGFARVSSGPSTNVTSSLSVVATRLTALSPTLIQKLTLHPANGPSVANNIGSNSVAMIVSGSSPLLTLDNVTLIAGLGGAGASGIAGASGRIGNNGVSGATTSAGAGGASGAACLSGTSPGAGGSGAADPSPDIYGDAPNGNAGSSAGSVAGGGGGGGGTGDLCMFSQSNGGDGGSGNQGQNGINGAAATLFSGAMFSSGGTYLAASSNGKDGTGLGFPGSGGGGGGAGGAMSDTEACDVFAAGGGGGGAGAGGCGGNIGSRGFGGGASIGLSVVSSSVSLRNVSVTTAGGGAGGNGGSGGNGGAGGAGQSGGTSTSAQSQVSLGGYGANGGAGGYGGNASGANGGPSFCWVVRADATVTEVTPLVCTLGAGGLRGTGGNVNPSQLPGGAPNGANGLAQSRFSY